MPSARWSLFLLLALWPVLFTGQGITRHRGRRNATRCRAGAQRERRDRPGDRRLCASRTGAGRGADAALVVLRSTPRRAGQRDAQHHQVHPCFARPGRCLRRAVRGARGERGHFHRLACHLAAMAPATSIGAASPVRDRRPARRRQMAARTTKLTNKKERAGDAGQPRKASKVLQDAIAYIRGLAQMRGRNVGWAEKAARGGIAPPEEAVKRTSPTRWPPTCRDCSRRSTGAGSRRVGARAALQTRGFDDQTHEVGRA